MATCRVETCPRPARTLGLCESHYARLKRTGDVRADEPFREPASPEQRFWSKVDRSRGADGCWIWTGARYTTGYGNIWWDGKKRPAHRVSLILSGRLPTPDRDMACHHCDNPPCVNPRHLYWGNYRTNHDDASRRGRASGGRATKSACAKGHLYTKPPSATHGGRCDVCSAANDRRKVQRRNQRYRLLRQMGIGADMAKRLSARAAWRECAHDYLQKQSVAPAVRAHIEETP